VTTQQARDQVRTVIQDGKASGDAAAFAVVRREPLTDQIPNVATPTLTTFLIRFSQVPTEEYVTVYAIPGTLVAYLDGNPTPIAPTSDVDANGNFTLPTPPTVSLEVSYAWQYFTDVDVDTFVNAGRAWLRDYPSVDQVPDGLTEALIAYAASRALRALNRKLTLATAKAGDAQVDFSDLAKALQAQADAQEKLAAQARKDYYSRADQTLQPGVDISTFHIPPYQPLR
jgi:hypothetical protein